MKIGIITWNEQSWCTSQLKNSLIRFGISPVCFSFQNLLARVNFEPKLSLNENIDLTCFDAIIVRPIGRGSLEEIIFEMDLLHRLKRLGIYILNSPEAIEHSVDKYYALTLLEEAGLPVPRTVVTESSKKALEAFHELGGDVIVKPIFGSRGMGCTRISDPNIAERVFNTLNFHRSVLYLQEFLPHENYDIRILVLGGRILSAMRRVADSWKTNISVGAKPEYYKVNKKIGELALKASKVIGCELSGIDILMSKKGPVIIENNSQPGWKGLQSVTKLNIGDAIINYVLRKSKNS
jgi:ribosomal protein S6--L-glutamate ligase/tetrahydromethanopterin:alpha-L-glutamate ligase